jgi:hypothetical protein
MTFFQKNQIFVILETGRMAAIPFFSGWLHFQLRKRPALRLGLVACGYALKQILEFVLF